MWRRMLQMIIQVMRAEWMVVANLFWWFAYLIWGDARMNSIILSTQFAQMVHVIGIFLRTFSYKEWSLTHSQRFIGQWNFRTRVITPIAPGYQISTIVTDRKLCNNKATAARPVGDSGSKGPLSLSYWTKRFSRGDSDNSGWGFPSLQTEDKRCGKEVGSLSLEG